MPSFLDYLLGDAGPPKYDDPGVEEARKHFAAVQNALDGPNGDNATLYSQTAALVSAANFPEPKKFAAQLMLRFLERCDALHLPQPHYEIAIKFLGVAAGLYVLERFTQLPPNPALYGYHGDNVVLGRIRDVLLRQQLHAMKPSATLDAFSDTLIASFVAVTRQLPGLAQTSEDGDMLASDTTSIALIDLLPDVAELIERVVEPFVSSKAKEFGLCRSLQTQLKENADRTAERLRSARPVAPSQFKGSPIDTVKAYLGDTFLDSIFLEGRVPFHIPDETRFSGQWIIAPPGRGKTTLLHSMLLEDIEAEASIIVMDSKGDLINPIKSMAAIADRLVLIEPDSHHPLALNPLDVSSANVPHTIALIEYILSGLLDAKFTNLQSALFRHALPAILQAVAQPTIEDLKRILANGLTADEMTKLDARLRQFFNDKTNGFHSKTYAETRSQIIWRLDFILTNDTMRAMFASPTTRLKIADAMNDGKIILIDASKAVLGDDGSEFYQRFFLALILAAAQQRSALKPSQKLPVYCYLDECQWVRNDQKLATILDECRSQKIALILAHQRTEQITSPNVLSAMSNCAIRFANSDDEAKYLAPKLRCDPKFLYSLPRGTFAAFVRDLTTRAVALKIPYTDVAALPQATAEQQTAIRRRMRAEYGSFPQPLPSSSATHPVAAAAPPSAPKSEPAPAVAPLEKPQAPAAAPEAGPTW
jgi:hypothetical protein